jgi:prepilin-type N-terminal cleavage/methylation domain-containing protein
MIRDQRGLTLVEILAAVAILGIGLTALLGVIPISAYGIHEGGRLSTATFLAEQRLEEVKSASWTSALPGHDCLGVGETSAPASTTCTRLTPAPCTAGHVCVTFPDEPDVRGFAGYGRSVRVTDCGAAPGCGVAPSAVIDANLRLVTVTVTYRPLTGVGAGGATGSRPMSLHLLVAKR